MSDTKPPAATAPAAPIVVSPEELIALYEQLQEREWNRESGAYKNPVTVMRSVVNYGRVAAGRIRDIFKRTTALEARVSALEAFKTELEGQAKQLEALMAQQPQIAAALPDVPTVPTAPTVPAVEPAPATAPATEAIAAEVTPITSKKPKAKEGA